MSNLITDPEKIRLQEEGEVQAILGRPPSWLTRWGITFVLVGMGLLLLLGSLLRYPDIVEAPAVILSDAPPVHIIAENNLEIEQLWVGDGERVDSGQLLINLENPVDLRAVQQVRTVLATVIPAIREKRIGQLRLPQGLSLAHLHPSYSQLSELLDAQQFLLAQNDVQRRLVLYREQLDALNRLNDINDIVIDTLQREADIAFSNQEIYAALLDTGAASRREFEQAQSAYLQYQRELEDKKGAYDRNELEIKALRERIITLSQEQSNEVIKGWIQLGEAAQRLQAELEAWEEDHLIKAPAAGRVVLAEAWNDHQFVSLGRVLLTIDPEAREKPVAVRANLPVAKSGKVGIGQQVLLRLQAYPYKEFGVLEGTIVGRAPFPEPGTAPFYRLRIELLSDSLITTSRDTIPLMPEMHATARIITEERSFLGRVMDELTSIFARN